jgi:peptide/nickel transport system substrate-binding protein
LALVGVGRVAKSIINTEMKWAFNSKAPDYPYDPAKAETLLDKAGYPRGKDGIRFKKRFLVIGGRGSDGRVGEVIRDQLKQVGIEAELIATDRATFVNTMFMNWDFDMAFQQGATAPDPTVGATRFIATNMIMKSPFVNATGFSNPEVDKLLDGEFKEQNKEKRVALWHRIQVIFNEELPMIPIYEQPLINVYRSEWTDVITGPDQAQVNGKTYKRK